ncbi:hypothetical protein JCM10212_004807 [Sporobolomyces blumeae]
MKPFVVRIDPESTDFAESSPPSDPTHDLAALQRLWNAWNGKAHKLLEQGTRIDNLFWRRWHMEQKMASHYPHGLYAPPVPPARGTGAGAAAGGVATNGYGANLAHFERLNEAGRQATRDLEAFLSNTLQAAQPAPASIPPNPPTFPHLAVTPSAYAQQLHHNLTNGSPSHAPYSVPAPHQRSPYQPSPEWPYHALPPVSQPPPLPTSSSGPHQNRIIATPAWTALISDSMAHPAMTSSAIPHFYPPPTVPMPSQHPQAQPPPAPAHAAPTYPQPPPPPIPLAPPPSLVTTPNSNPYAFVTPNLAHPQPLHPASFTLPPSATLFSDLPSALSSAPLGNEPPAYFSSYGVYQPIHDPYPRFLTPSPEPAILNELELDLNGTLGGVEFDSNPLATGDGGGDVDIWKDLEGVGMSAGPGTATTTTSDGGGDASSYASPPLTGAKRDPFEGMSLAEMRSRANSLEAVDREAARYEGIGSSAETNASAKRAAQEVKLEVEGDKDGHGAVATASKGKAKRKNERDGGGQGKKNKPPSEHSPVVDATSLSLHDSPPTDSDGIAAAGSSKSVGGAAAAGSAAAGAGSKKNRNPHSTQLPGNGQRRQPKEEAGEGHQGPVCSHCGSITTPLWRRGPNDELLCNACGLYLKLHSKPRPKTFGKGAGSKRPSTGAAAQAAAKAALTGVPPSCSNCGVQSTPFWRLVGTDLCCNACSLYYKLHKVPRPASLAQKRAAAAAAKANLAATANSTNPPSLASSPGDGPPGSTPNEWTAAQTPATTSTPMTPSTDEAGGAAAPQPAPLQPAVMPPPHAAGSMPPPPLPPSSHVQSPYAPPPLLAPPTWPIPPSSTSPYLNGIPLPAEPTPFAQTSWGALAYQLVSAAAEEEAGQPPHHPPTS